MSMITRLLPALLLLATASCQSVEIHQGNVFKTENIRLIQKGDSRFQVETLLGIPALHDPLHPERVRYIEDIRHSDSGENRTRVIEITYDEALRVDQIKYVGF